MPQYISKLILNGVTQMDVTQDTVAANNLLQGETATKNDGSPVTGAYVPTTPTGNINITQSGVTDVTNYATATVYSADVAATMSGGFITQNSVRKWMATPAAYAEGAGWIDEGPLIGDPYYYDAIPANTTVTPSKSAQTIGGSNTMMEGAVTVAAVPEAELQFAETWGTYFNDGGFRKWQSNMDAYFVGGYINDGLTTFNGDVYRAIPTGTTITPSTSAQTVGGANYMMEGPVTVAAMPSGTATPAASISGTSATVSTGTNTLTLSKTVSNTPQVSAGYVSSGTAGNSNVSLTANVTTKAAATITPGTTNQTINSGTYLTGTQTISGDANLVAGNIKSGTTIFGVTGTYSGGGGTLTVATKTATMSAVGQTLSFTSLAGTPKYWFVKTTSQISSSGSTTYYYITDGFWDGTSVKGNSFRIGSTRRIYSWTSGVTQSYSGGTLTITGGSATGSSPGQFYNGSYELTYIY